MCGLVRVRAKEDPFVSETRVEAHPYRETDAKPSAELMVWRRHPDTGVPTEGMLRWGLIPHWMKVRPEIRPINARAETSARSGCSANFRQAPLHRANGCVLERDKRKKLHAFAMKDGKPFGVAGIWENWRNSEGNGSGLLHHYGTG